MLPLSMHRLVLMAALVAFVPRVHADSTRPSLDGAASLARNHDDQGALRVLDALSESERATLEALYLRARLLERDGRLDEAADALARIPRERLPEPLGDELGLRRARLLARTGRCGEARPELERRAQLHGAPPLAAALAGECALELGANEAAVRWLSSIARSNDESIDRFTILRTLAVALDRLERGDEAAARLREAFLADPAHPDAWTVRAELRSRAAPLAELDARERASIVERLQEARAYERALLLLDEVGEPSARDELARHLHLRGRILFAMRTRYEEAAATLDRAVRLRGPHALDDELMAARAMLRAGDDAEAIRRYDRLAERQPRTPEAQEARYTAALITLREGGPRAARRMTAFLAAEGPSARGERIGAGHYLLALHHMGHGAHREARPHLELACRRRPERLSREGCAYFTARLAEIAGETRVARGGYRSLATDAANEWYGLLARRRLSELGEADVAATPAPPPTAPSALALPPGVAFLASVGLDEDAAKLLRQGESAVRGDGPAALASLVLAYARLGDASRSFRLARQGASATERGDPGLHAYFVEAMHPRPHADVVETLGARLGVDTSYVYGTMRQESGFDPTAVSRVGAIGLLQMMPRTAARAAARAGIELDPSMLFDARTNVRVALVEMAGLVRRYRGHIALVAASYNAGIASTDEWLDKRRDMPLDLFVEWIPFDETRGYVRRVVGHTARYQALSGHPEAGPGLVAPLPSGLP